MSKQNEAPEFVVEWEDPADAETCWQYDPVHTPGAISPLACDLAMRPFVEGFGWWSKALWVNYYMFYPVRAQLPGDAQPLPPPPPSEETLERLREGGRRWREEILPEVQGHIDRFRTTDFDAMPDEELAAEIERLPELRHHCGRLHTLSVTPPYIAMQHLIDTYNELTGGGDLDALRLVQGYGNKSVEAGEGLWRLSKLAVSIPSVAERLADIDASNAREHFDELERDPSAGAFVEAFRTYLDEFGWRSGGDFGAPTWAEDPSVPLTMLRAYMEAKDYDHVAEQRRLGEEREIAVRDTLAQLEGAARQRLSDTLDVVKDVMCMTEDHNYYIDQRLYTMPRRLVLAAARRLVAAGQLDRETDVFLLHDTELLEALRGQTDSARATALRRREEMAYWRSATPPPYIGAAPPEEAPRPASPRRHEGDNADLRGTPASGGVARGPARIVATLAEADRLRPGDVLVTNSTLPAWTPLFAIASAVVTEVGGVLGHTAIVAREYGIPAVLNARDAMRRLPDGQLIEVDGSAGVVRVVG
ncbi:MAG: PEP-utilizing enzyme [Dehalococcoidia bacterium]